MKRYIIGCAISCAFMMTTFVVRAQDTKPDVKDPCQQPSEVPCVVDQLRLQAQGLTIDRDNAKKQLAEANLQLANLALMESSNTGSAMIMEMYTKYDKKQEDYEFKMVDRQWHFVRRNK